MWTPSDLAMFHGMPIRSFERSEQAFDALLDFHSSAHVSETGTCVLGRMQSPVRRSSRRTGSF